MGKLNLNFSYSFNGKIWNIISHPQQELLLLEVRRHEKFLTTFSLLNTATGKLIFNEIEFEEKWWIGATSIFHDIILFHVYPDQGNPEVKDMFAYDFVEEKILWNIQNQNIITADPPYVSALAPEGEGTIHYDIISGKVVKTPNLQKVDVAVKNKMQQESFHYREGGEHFETVSRFLKMTFGKDAVKGVDYYENNKVIVISYYNWDGNGKLDNHLLAVDHKGELLLDICLGKGLKGISNNAFFIYYNKLIFVKDNSNVLIYQLP